MGANEVSLIKNIVGASLVIVTAPDSLTVNTSTLDDLIRNISPPVPLISKDPVILASPINGNGYVEFNA